MAEKETRQENMQIIMFIERRAQRREDLTCEEIMNLARKRGSKGVKRVIDVEPLPANPGKGLGPQMNADERG
jgi:hypothetical protein